MDNSSQITSTTPVARHNMVARQIRTWQVLDQAVLGAFEHVPREAYVPHAWKSRAYLDMDIPLGENGDVLLSPKVLGRMIQALSLPAGQDFNCLVFSSGAGYIAALLAAIGRQVRVEVFERDAASAGQTRHNLQQQQVPGISVQVLQDALELPSLLNNGPYDGVLLGGSVTSIPEILWAHTKGALVALVGEPDALVHVERYSRDAGNFWQKDSVFETTAPPLTAFARRVTPFAL